jgi:hypothetical protein
MFIPEPDFFPSRIRIPDPGVKKAPDPGSGTATLLPNCTMHISFDNHGYGEQGISMKHRWGGGGGGSCKVRAQQD